MDSSLEPNTDQQMQHRRATKRKGSAKIFLLIWVLMIGGGVLATYLYSNHMKQEMLQTLKMQTDEQIAVMRTDYESRMNTIAGQLDTLQSKVDSFNELLTFTKDNASDKTDNSNKLYTQLADVKKKLDQLQKQMDLLK